jgi:hypothetical protein
MSNGQVNAQHIDQWVKDDSDVAALVMHQWLEPVEGKNAVIFPPTYAKPERMREEDWLGYNIDKFEGGSSVCQSTAWGLRLTERSRSSSESRTAILYRRSLSRLETMTCICSTQGIVPPTRSFGSLT